MAFPSGTPNVAACMSIPSTNCINLKLLGMLNPLVLGTLNVIDEVVS